MIGPSHSKFRSPLLTLATLSAKGNLGLLLKSALTSSTGVSTALTLAIALTAFRYWQRRLHWGKRWYRVVRLSYSRCQSILVCGEVFVFNVALFHNLRQVSGHHVIWLVVVPCWAFFKLDPVMFTVGAHHLHFNTVRSSWYFSCKKQSLIQDYCALLPKSACWMLKGVSSMLYVTLFRLL